MNNNYADMDKYDQNVSISVLKNTVKVFCEDRDWDQYHNPKDLAVAIITEASELLELFRFKTQDDMVAMMDNPDKRIKIADELSDIFYFILRFSEKYDYDLTREFFRKMTENEKKYPVDKFKGSNKKYSEAGE